MNSYTLITGARNGFGKALAFECASRNMPLILVDLPGSGIEETARFISEAFKIQVYGLVADLSDPDQCRALHEKVSRSSLPVRYLINNAGVLSHGYFEELDTTYILRQIQVNAMAPALLTRLFLDDLKANGPSAVLNVGSMASHFYLPRKQIYGGTKAFLLSFSQSLRRELKPHGISVCTISPGGMNTTPDLCYRNRSGGWISQKSIMAPEAVARIAIRGMLDGKEEIIPGRLNQMFMFLNLLLPKPLKEFITRKELAKIHGETGKPKVRYRI